MKKVSVGEGIDLFITYEYAVKKKSVRQERKIEKKWINVPFSDDLGGCFEVNVQKQYLTFVLYHVLKVMFGPNKMIFGPVLISTWLFGCSTKFLGHFVISYPLFL